MKILTKQGQINIERSGNPNGPTLLMAHSLGCNLHMWDPQMPLLEPKFDVIRLDMRGHGKSDSPTGPYNFEQLASDVITVMDELEIDQCHWIGLSIGGMIGQSLLLDYPNRFRSAVLCDTMSKVPSEALMTWNERIEKVETDGLGSIKQATLERWFTENFRQTEPDIINKVGEQIDEATDSGYIACSQAIMQLDFINALSTIDIPVLLITGREDIATPVTAAQAMHERLPNSSIVLIDNAAHISNIEQPELFNNALLPFLERHT